jgi:hypothetical protein
MHPLAFPQVRGHESRTEDKSKEDREAPNAGINVHR